MVSAVQPLAERWDDLAADRFAPVLDRSPEGLVGFPQRETMLRLSVAMC